MEPRRLVQVDIFSPRSRGHGGPYILDYIPNPRQNFNPGGRTTAAPDIKSFEDLVVNDRRATVFNVSAVYTSSLVYFLVHENNVAVTAFHYRNLRDVFGKRAYSHWRGLGDRLRKRLSILKISGQSYPPGNGSDARTLMLQYEPGRSWKTGAGVPLQPGIADPRVVYIEYLPPAQPQEPINPNDWEMVPVKGNMMEFRRRRGA